MLRARALCVVVVMTAIVMGPGSATGSPAPGECGRLGVMCSRVAVPLDWTGKVHGTVSLEVKVERATHPRGVMFLLAGGPGQASSDVFSIVKGSDWQRLFPGYTLVAFDPRGTGGSGVLRCRSPAGKEGPVATVAACARKLGPARDFYATADNARDVDAVRRALGLRRIGLFGVSYGTDVALTYARMFPAHVERLLLDSVASPVTALPVVRDVLRALPGTLSRFCARACPGATSDYSRDTVRLANSLARKPLRGEVPQAGGGTRLETVDATRFLDLVFGTDLDAGLAAEMPAVVHAAVDGDRLPLLRLGDLLEPSSSQKPSNTLGAVYLATTCDDGPLPWPAGTPLAERPKLLKAAEDEVPGLTGPFGRWATLVGNARVCSGWPDSAAPPSPAPSPYPNVPVLALSGTFDLRSPILEARAALAGFPRGHLLAVANAGHSVLQLGSTCVRSAVQAWLGGRTVPSRCSDPRPLAPLGPLPARGSKPANDAQILALVAMTIRDAEAMSLLGQEEGISAIPGLAGGALRGYYDLLHYSLAGGIGLTGNLTETTFLDRPGIFHGVFRVERGSKTIGELALNGDSLDGILDGSRVVDSRPTPMPLPPAAGAHAWSDWAPPEGATGPVATAIAAHVSGRYLLHAGGAPLVSAGQGPPRSPGGDVATAIAVYRLDLATIRYLPVSTAWTYTLCGAAQGCAIPGKPSHARFTVVAREALELALYTFEYVPSLDTVLVRLPPPRGSGPPGVILFERSALGRELSRPLAATLPLATPPLPSDPDTREAHLINSLTEPNVFKISFAADRFGPIVDLSL